MTTTIRDHGVEDYLELPDMDASDVGTLSDDDRACLDDLGRYLASTDGWCRFGIWLLHKHFHPEVGEVFVERALQSPRRTETTLIDRATLPAGELSATAIRFDDSIKNGVGVIGMEFALPGDFGDTSPLSDADEAVLAGLAERLRAHDRMDRFGVRLIRNPLGLSDDELLHETSDVSGRTLHCIVSERDAVLAEQTTIQTAWRFRAVQGTTDTVVMQECTASCVRVGEGHDIGHSASGTDNDDNPTEGEPNLPF